MSSTHIKNLSNKLVSSALRAIEKKKFRRAYWYLFSAAGLNRRFPFNFKNEELESALEKWSTEFFKISNPENRKINNMEPPQGNTTWIITSSIKPSGGHSRFALNLMRSLQLKAKEPQSFRLVLTHQTTPLPELLKNLKSDSVYHLHSSSTNPIQKILTLRKLICNNSTGHIYYLIDPDDIVPILALQHLNYPSTFINHADDSFWAGTQLANNYAEMRYEGLYISTKFRKIENKKSVMMPIPLQEIETPLAPLAPENHPLLANIRNIPESAFVCLSVNPSYKLTPYKQFDFYETLERIIEISPQIWIIAIGYGIPEKIKSFSEKFKERIICWDSFHYDMAPLFKRAHILLDGFPFGSTTVMLEFLSYKKPFVTLAIPQAEVLGSQDPRLSCPEFEVVNRISYLQKVQSFFEYYQEHQKYAEEYFNRFKKFSHIEFKPVLKFETDFVMNEELILEIIRNCNGFTRWDFYKFVVKLRVPVYVKWKMVSGLGN